MLLPDGVKVTTVNPAFFPCFLESTSQYHVKKNKQRGLLRIYLKQCISGSFNTTPGSALMFVTKLGLLHMRRAGSLQSCCRQHPIFHPKRSEPCTMQARELLSSISTIPFETLSPLNLGGPHSCLPQLHEGTSTVPTPKQPHWSHRGLRQEGTI